MSVPLDLTVFSRCLADFLHIRVHPNGPERAQRGPGWFGCGSCMERFEGFRFSVPL